MFSGSQGSSTLFSCSQSIDLERACNHEKSFYGNKHVIDLTDNVLAAKYISPDASLSYRAELYTDALKKGNVE